MDGLFLPEFDGTGALIAPWAGEERRFRMAIGELRELDGVLREPPSVTIGRLLDGNGRFSDVRQVLYFGLIGGGMARADATALVCREIDESPLMMTLTLTGLAALILLSAVSGPRSSGEDDGDDEPAASGPPKRLPFATMVRNGAAMGFSPQQVNAMSLWEFERAQEGWMHAHGAEDGGEPPAPSDERYEELMRDG